MKLNISYPATGCQKLIEVDDERKVRIFYEKRMSQEVAVESLGDEWKGYVVRIAGGNDKQGFPMKQGVLTTNRVRLLLSKGHSCYRPRRSGERRRKSVRGCIVDASLSVLNLVIIKKGENEIPGLTDSTVPRRLGPKRASKIRKLFNLSKSDDVRQYVVRRPLPAKEGKKERTKAPKIQRLVTPLTLQRKRHKIALKKKRAAKKRDEAAEYAKLLAQRLKEAKERKLERRRSASQSKSSISRDSTSASAAKPAPAQAKGAKGAKGAKPTAKQAKAVAEMAKAASKTGKPAPKGGKPTGKPAGKPTGKPAGKPTGKPAAKSTKPAGKPAAKPTGKPAAKSGAKPSGKPAAKSAKPAKPTGKAGKSSGKK